ncbi:hypothetical protein Kpol_187p1 [Vanderwaltozyma polyspora DSM 70294]|uniref:ATP-dependent DNA helicase CHL1 n=1 Tax=Vanderwaltozyma polyspora (strain ATCC 22028 / DSM 70294 / BCRC 21397 / CBS 2163 / NBRC 10782 / NRRL Y-8283 / UCD 57-17) TaxID=436907 RepID=CHL1_VANPO|nr:uncharacterized protein Kpol_187p1 [Vanderwaltozyma polyspora DSM 70294]A7TTL0.1 RecName: Full=ATP-dependent DNA helicase CHL1; AltName: Full=Chromosome loss protein 1 [Vanderwaltozyma polyspora DSM 70294]EDO14396.1 hypothetical protein Kpol_187p1 [Vanderwaltozyma polyspora DSM 70294]
MLMSFNHPYQPYEIQLQLMQCIYGALSSGKKIAILESPTGTGKTLSLLCSSITWLRDNKLHLLSQNLNNGGIAINSSIELSDDDDFSDDEPNWVNESYNSSILDNKLLALNDYEKHLDTIANKHYKIDKNLIGNDNNNNKVKRRKIEHIPVGFEEDEFLPQDYISDSEELEQTKSEALSNEVKALLAKLDSKSNDEQTTSTELLQELNPVKIFFASRTHSQLKQFASQLKLPKFKSSFDEKFVSNERLKYLPLGSRKQLCINKSITSKWKSTEAINDACKELLQSEKGCPYHNKNTSNTLFRDHVFTGVHDIEDILALGESLNVCPYYATRDSITSAEIITLPYQYLLSESTRDSLNIDLSNSIVIVDEAHNLIDTINTIHSSHISLQELKTCQIGLQMYFAKFKSRLNAGNRVNLLKLIKLLDILIEYINKNFKKSGQEISANEIFNNTNADTLNIHKLNQFIKVSKIAYKIDTYLNSLSKESDNENNEESKNKSTPLLFKVASFLSSLTNPNEEGKFFFEKNKSIKYMLLEPSQSFKSILDEARCVILAGGTMEPISDFFDNLFPDIIKDKSVTFACDHVIPDDNLNTYIIEEPKFEFTFDKRQNPELVNKHLFQFFIKLSVNVPPTGGIVAFFPSYSYLQFVIDNWRSNGLFDKLNKIREIFYESKNGSDPLDEYIKVIEARNPAILFAVVGGKLSEGINFQDDLCRAVVMTGLPYPNVMSGELLIKKNHIETKILKNGGSKADVSCATKDFFDTICMKAVNQSVGRAIRHIDDYSNIYLLDQRYSNSKIKDKLSQWVRKRIQPETNLELIMEKSNRTFQTKKTSN